MDMVSQIRPCAELWNKLRGNPQYLPEMRMAGIFGTGCLLAESLVTWKCL